MDAVVVHQVAATVPIEAAATWANQKKDNFDFKKFEALF
jgi:hypothetical protein